MKRRMLMLTLAVLFVWAAGLSTGLAQQKTPATGSKPQVQIDNISIRFAENGIVLEVYTYDSGNKVAGSKTYVAKSKAEMLTILDTLGLK